MREVILKNEYKDLIEVKAMNYTCFYVGITPNNNYIYLLRRIGPSSWIFVNMNCYADHWVEYYVYQNIYEAAKWFLGKPNNGRLFEFEQIDYALEKISELIKSK